MTRSRAIAAQFRAITPESLGREYEESLSRAGHRPTRKAGGVYYTPDYITRYIVHWTLGPLLRGKTLAEVQNLAVLDPACGGGAFLLAAYEHLLNWYTQRSGKPLTAADRMRIISRHLFGVDLDPRAVEITRQALALKAGTRATDALEENVRSGNALLGLDYPRTGFDWQAAFPQVMKAGGFAVVIGNPPYRAALTASERDYLTKKFGLSTSDTAALLMVQAYRLTRPGGWNGFIVPKPFTYASNWRHVRDLLLDEITELADAGKVWPAVKLEQVIYTLQKGKRTRSYLSLCRKDQGFIDLGVIPKPECARFGFVLNGISPAELAVARKMQQAGRFLGEMVTNTRGALLQGALRKNSPGRRVIGGKQIRRYYLAGAKGYLSPDHSVPPNALARPGSILVQNIVAHITRPTDHIKIIGAVVSETDAQNLVLLDTVNQLTNRSPYSSHYLFALLHSRLVNWYVYRFIFATAVRTMHFDGPVTDRIPVPGLDLRKRTDQGRHDRLAALARRLAALHSDEDHQPLERQLDQLVYALYGLKAGDVRIVEGSKPSGVQ